MKKYEYRNRRFFAGALISILCSNLFAVSLQFYGVLIKLEINTALGLVQTLKHLGCVCRDQRTSHREMMSPVGSRSKKTKSQPQEVISPEFLP